jgi:hypothetical protein
MNKELEDYAERTARAFDNDNYKALMQLVIEGAKYMQEKMYSEEEVRKLLQVQRGNCFVAIFTKTKDRELALLAISAHEPNGKWVKNFNV